MKYLDGSSMQKALKNGVQRVIASQDGLNRINVFPVADGDTGTNMALTVGAMGGVLTNEAPPLHRLLERAADALLDGARGNSGAILAQFFQGVSDTAAELTRFSTDTFAKAVKAGSSYARDALAEPREGTILSVIDAYADALAKAPVRDDFAALMSEGLKAAETALAATKHQLDVLRKADVVDAGAKGFVALIHGMLAFVRDGEIVEELSLPDDMEEVLMAGEETDLDFRYCTECVIVGEGIDRRKLREDLSRMGGSLVLAGSHRKAKVHIHVNNPDEVFRLARGYGEVKGEKADDMHRQQHTTHSFSSQVAVITDSSADLSEQDIDNLDVHFVPLRIQFGKQGYLDKLSIRPDEFFEELARNPIHPTTSQPSPGDYRRQFQFLASHYEQVLAITLSAAVSGTHAAALSAAARIDAPGTIHVVDSKNGTLGQGLIVREAAAMASNGMTIEQIREQLDTVIANTTTYALVSDFKYVVRGGRVPRSTKIIADFLKLNGVLQTLPSGEVKPKGVVFGRKHRVSRFARYVAKRLDLDRPVRLAIGHGNAEEDATALAQALTAQIPNLVDVYITEVCAAFGVHGGPGMLVVATLEQ
ncbi:MAG: DegV family protein [Pseudomonadota bacterium]